MTQAQPEKKKKNLSLEIKASSRSMGNHADKDEARSFALCLPLGAQPGDPTSSLKVL